MSEGRGRGTSRREALVWLAVLSIPPGVGMVGFVAVAMAGGAVTPGAIAAGVATTGLIAGVLTVVLEFGPDEETTD
ncbi:hypothetical protein ACFR9U_01595 [Halorientalis brevis]|uniref:Uncharacterized protein n=1 Tax=Halorientalis brevis TaxID=1126241 RepID=A0ABD6C636_9EURY|nr:hypothetical protein [Halorientalis brevis]